MIPHVIHYCWFGHNKKPDLIQKCIESWKKVLPDWEIIEWNESNYDVNKIEYTRKAYEAKKWAYVVDYARFDILNRYGGVFLDTDVELIKPIPKYLFEYEAFTGFETDKNVAPGLAYASIPNQKILNILLETYQNKSFSMEETIVDITTNIFRKFGLKENNTFQVIENVAICPQSVFCAFDHETQSFDITEDTISIHHYFASWSPWYKKIKFKIIKCVVNIIGKERYMSIKKKIKR